jgi:hypothetical protein
LSGGIIPNSASGQKGQYLYTPVTKNGLSSWGFVLMANAETEGWANYVYCGAATPTITGWTQIAEWTWGIKQCKSIRKSSTGACAWRTLNTPADMDCTYGNANQLRYIYVY